MKAVAFIRKSTNGRDEFGRERQEGSFDRQKATILDYAKRKGIEIIRWYEEPMSGKSIRKRKIFHQMVKEAKSPSRLFNAIIFGEYDRFMRDVKEAMRYEVELDDAGVELHFTNLRNDGSPEDDMFKSLARNMAAKYSVDLAQRVVQGMLRKAKMGCWLGGVPPFGYRTIKDANDCTWLVIYEPEAKVVRLIFVHSSNGWGHRKIARWLNGQGIPASETARKRNSALNKNPDGRWSGETVRHLLRNPVYKGVMRWNKRARVDCFDWRHEGQGTVEIGKLRTENDQFRKSGDRFSQRSEKQFFIDRSKSEEEWITVEGKAPQIIEPAIFDAIQARLKKYSGHKWRKKNSIKALMTGALTCMTCGGNKFHGHHTWKTLKSTGKRVAYGFYRCSGDVRKGSHAGLPNNLMLTQQAIDNVAEEGLRARITPLTRPERVGELFEGKLRKLLNGAPNRLAEVEKEIKTIRTEQERMIYAYSKFETPIPEDKVKELKSRLKFLEAQRDGLIAAGHDKMQEGNLKQTVNRFLVRLKEMRRGLDIKDPQEKIRIREAFLQKAEVFWYNPEPKVKMFWRKVPWFADCNIRSTSTTYYANQEDEDEDLEVETYVYRDSRLVRVAD